MFVLNGIHEPYIKNNSLWKHSLINNKNYDVIPMIVDFLPRLMIFNNYFILLRLIIILTAYVSILGDQK